MEDSSMVDIHTAKPQDSEMHSALNHMDINCSLQSDIQQSNNSGNNSTCIKISSSNDAEAEVPERPKTPENFSVCSNSTQSSPATPRDGIPAVPPLLGIEGYASSLSASSTPRDGSSSGSPSPVPEEGASKNVVKDRPTVKLGKDLSLMMQALNSLQSPEEKIAALCKKYADLLEQHKLLQKQMKISQRKQAQILKEKEQLQAANNKTSSAKLKLESLCRELQRRNKAIKEEQNQKSMEEIALRQEMAAEFETTLNRIQNQMKTAVDGSTKLQSENERIGGKLNEIVEKYQARETAMENLVKQHNLQEQLVTAQLEKTILEHQEEKEKDAAEKQKLMEQIIERTMLYESKVKQEKELRAQLQYYSEKFEDFQSTLEKSNEIFASFRSEMDKMSKKLKQAEKYRATIQKKWEDSTRALAETVDYTQQLESKQARLEKLSRALQAERNDLAQRLRQYEGNSKKGKDGSKRKKNVDDQKKDKTNVEKADKPPSPLVEDQNVVNCKKELTELMDDNDGGKENETNPTSSEDPAIDHPSVTAGKCQMQEEQESDVVVASSPQTPTDHTTSHVSNEQDASTSDATSLVPEESEPSVTLSETSVEN